MAKYPFRGTVPLIIFLMMAFFAGRGIADFAQEWRMQQNDAQVNAQIGGIVSEDVVTARQEADGAKTTAERLESHSERALPSSGMAADSSFYLESAWPFDLQHPLLPGTENWGLGFGTAGSKPVGNASVEEMKKYNAYYMAEGEDKKIYLTFDCGYENGNTGAILDALANHNAKATFFVVGHFLETAPELVKRMVEEGHAVGNHTYHHPDMSKISDQSTFQKEMDDVRNLFREITGQEMPMYYRPPQGKYNTQNLTMAKDLGYATFFWSLAYVDWNVDAQPTHEEAFSKLTTRIHPGAIVLLHNTSKTNGEILDELLTKWEEMGYSFGSLAQFLESCDT